MQLKQSSLKSKLLLQLATPLLLFMVVESVLSYFVTLHYVNNAYDGWLLDSARSLAQELKVQNGQPVVELPPAALEMFKWDDQDKTYFKITTVHDGLIAGDPAVPEFKPSTGLRMQLPEQLRQVFPILSADNLDPTLPRYFNGQLYGESVRVVVMRVMLEHSAEQCFVSVAETENKRRRMMLDILVADLGPQSLLLLLTGVYLMTGVRRGLRPLNRLADEIAKRSSQDLHPIPETHIVQEAQTLIHTINDLFGRLSLAIATQERFIANAAHQLRTPLAGLKLQAERALREDDIHAMQPALVQIKNSADRLSRITSQLLVLARSEPNQHSYALKPLALGEFTRSICIDWVQKALERRMNINFECPATDLQINADNVLLRELLNNLIDNAITYGAENGNIIITVAMASAPQLIITDDGPGINSVDMDKIFERFYRSPGSIGHGSGLGLAIVKEIADLHGAEIKLSRVNAAGGTCIKVLFPNNPITI